MSLRVVIADDHAVVRDGVRLILTAERDIEVVGDAADGREAVRLVQRLKPEVALLDVAMPGLNGIEATARIVASGAHTRVVVLSMHATSEHIHRALQAGARGYLVKESAGSEVVAAVRAVAAGRIYLSAAIAETVVREYARHGVTAAGASPLERLSAREREVLQLVAEGRSSAEIARLVFLSPKTVDTYRSRLMAKLGIGDVPGLVKFAIQHGLIRAE
ncbi:MAG: response regulator [Acidobacteriota bacterium]